MAMFPARAHWGQSTVVRGRKADRYVCGKQTSGVMKINKSGRQQDEQDFRMGVQEIGGLSRGLEQP
jgi:hypothetical protein